MTFPIARAALASLSLAFGCGGAQHATDPSAPATAAAAKDPAPSSAAPEATAQKDAPTKAKSDETADTKPDEGAKAPPDKDAKPTASGDDKDSKKTREVTFQMTPTGLVIEVEGVRMEPKAQALRIEDKDGKFAGWGVKLTMKVAATDSHVHRFTKPEHGALMMAAEVDRKGKKEQIGDERKGDGEETITKESPATFERDFKKPIGAGQSVTLQVGLWGMGRDTEEKRLVRKLFVVKMVGANKKPNPVVSPPE
jgi:hypothetical protein